MDLLKNPITRWTRRKDVRAQEILNAAIELFVERGFSSTRLDDVAAKAGVSKGTVYLYYKNKDDLLSAVVKTTFSDRINEIKARLKSHKGTMAELLVIEFEMWWKNIGDGPLSGIPKLILSEARNFPEIARFYYHEVVRPFWAHLQLILQTGIDRGEFRPMDTEYTVRVMLSPLLHMSMWRHSLDAGCGIETDTTRFIQSHIQLTLFGLLSEKDSQRKS